MRTPVSVPAASSSVSVGTAVSACRILAGANETVGDGAPAAVGVGEAAGAAGVAPSSGSVIRVGMPLGLMLLTLARGLGGSDGVRCCMGGDGLMFSGANSGRSWLSLTFHIRGDMDVLLTESGERARGMVLWPSKHQATAEQRQNGGTHG